MGNIDFRDPNVQIAGMVVFVSLVIGYVFFFSSLMPFGFKERSTQIGQLQTEYEELSADLMKAKQTASRLPQVREEYEQLSAKWDEAKTLLPTEKEMADLLAQVTVAGQRSGVNFLLFEPKPAAPRDIYMENPIEIQVEGSYHQIGMFMSRTSNLPRIINVNAIEMKNIPNPIDKDGADLVQATMQMSAYTLLSEAQRAQAQSAPAANGGRPV
ncbi:type 4a pilus biogenesis protein PilO, partial [bacterium]|nr:type 4a pilus biogenesis protein PilO [bacterium]